MKKIFGVALLALALTAASTEVITADDSPGPVLAQVDTLAPQLGRAGEEPTPITHLDVELVSTHARCAFDVADVTAPEELGDRLHRSGVQLLHLANLASGRAVDEPPGATSNDAPRRIDRMASVPVSWHESWRWNPNKAPESNATEAQLIDL